MKPVWLRRAGFLLALWVPLAARAGDALAPADLPPEAAALAALGTHPSVRAARARHAAALAEGERLRLGSHEYQARVGYQRREESGVGNFNEWELALERGVRLPGKARLDGELGKVLGEEAEERVGEARHEAARDLLRQWYAALRGASGEALWAGQVDLLGRQVGIVEKRVRAGDAARMERHLAEAALRQAKAEQARARAEAARAKAELAVHFPDLPPPVPAEGSVPVLEGGLAAWVDAALSHNHELAAIQKAAEGARLGVRRHEADLTPDPVIGLRLASERDGDEHLAGVTLTLPLPGESRRAMVAVGQGLAAALAEDEVAARRRIAAEIGAAFEQAGASLAHYQARRAGAAEFGAYAELAWRAYQLGESGLAEALNARRSALEAEREAALARLDASESVARLLLDTHRLWMPEEAHPR